MGNPERERDGWLAFVAEFVGEAAMRELRKRYDAKCLAEQNGCPPVPL